MNIRGVDPFKLNKPAAQKALAPRQPIFGADRDPIKDRGKGLEEDYFRRIEREIAEKLAKPEIQALMAEEAVPAAEGKPGANGVQVLKTLKETEKTEDAARGLRSDKPMALVTDLLNKFTPAQQPKLRVALRKMLGMGLIESTLHPQARYAPGEANKNLFTTNTTQVEGLKTTLLGYRAILKFKD